MPLNILCAGNKMRITFLPLYEIDQPSSRYRVFQFLPSLTKLGFHCTVLEAPQRRPLKRLLYVPRLLPLAVKSDVLFVQKRMLPAWLLSILERLKVKIIFDIDDAVHLRPLLKPKIERMMRAARIVITGNEYLADYARNHNSDVIVIPTVVDTALYHPIDEPRHPGDDRVIIGWIGSDPNRGDLTPLKPVFDWLGERYKNKVVLRIVSDHPLQMETILAIEFVPWTLVGSLAALQQFDIGIMPLDHTLWNQGKCGLKLIEYMAVGAASVASPVGVNRQIVSNEETGYLAATDREWQERLACLIEQNVARRQMGQLAVKRIEQRYSIKAVLPKLVNALKQADV
jgi:glycosyltransferase involved in cell wall biosynthesis